MVGVIEMCASNLIPRSDVRKMALKILKAFKLAKNYIKGLTSSKEGLRRNLEF